MKESVLKPEKAYMYTRVHVSKYCGDYVRVCMRESVCECQQSEGSVCANYSKVSVCMCEPSVSPLLCFLYMLL